MSLTCRRTLPVPVLVLICFPCSIGIPCYSWFGPPACSSLRSVVALCQVHLSQAEIQVLRFHPRSLVRDPDPSLPSRPCSTSLGFLRWDGFSFETGLVIDRVEREDGIPFPPVLPSGERGMGSHPRRRWGGDTVVPTTPVERSQHVDGAAMRPATVARGKHAGWNAQGKGKGPSERKGKRTIDVQSRGVPNAVPKVSTDAKHTTTRTRTTTWKSETEEEEFPCRRNVVETSDACERVAWKEMLECEPNVHVDRPKR